LEVVFLLGDKALVQRRVAKAFLSRNNEGNLGDELVVVVKTGGDAILFGRKL
jgi:hypothetical protein